MTHSPIQRQRLLDRFLEYVRIDTTANPNATSYPSSEGQRTLGSLLTEQLRQMTASEVHQDENGLVWATIPATVAAKVPTVALIAHLDTSPEAPGGSVNPQVIDDYRGGDIRLTNGAEITVAQAPELADLIGTTLITTDGRTLLGGDDKAGIAIIMELAHYLIDYPYLPHGPIRILFTCDEEIGRGTDHIDLDKLAADVGYTLDGGGAGQLDVETFSADGATVSFHGKNIHPSIGKGRMVNAIRAAAEFVSRLPHQVCSPETTCGQQGFVHPYDLSGGVAEAKLKVILRSFESGDLVAYASLLRGIADEVTAWMPGLRVNVDVYRQYRNLAEGLRQQPLSIELADAAFKNLGRSCERTRVRGGTDGSQLTEKGLPTPNLSSGQHNIHSPLEFACLDEMVAATEHLVELLTLWQDRGRS